jgi:hypothetical protein
VGVTFSEGWGWPFWLQEGQSSTSMSPPEAWRRLLLAVGSGCRAATEGGTVASSTQVPGVTAACHRFL